MINNNLSHYFISFLAKVIVYLSMLMGIVGCILIFQTSTVGLHLMWLSQFLQLFQEWRFSNILGEQVPFKEAKPQTRIGGNVLFLHAKSYRQYIHS